MAGYALRNGEYIEFSRLSQSELEEILDISLKILSHNNIGEISKGVYVLTRDDIICCVHRDIDFDSRWDSHMENISVEKIKERPRYKIIYDLLERYKSKNEAAEDKTSNPDINK